MSPALVAQLAVLTPLVGAVLIALSHRRPNQREAVTLITAGILFLLVLSLLPEVLAGARPRALLAEPIPGLPLALEVEPLGMLFALVASALWIVTSLYSIGYMRGHDEAHQTRFYVYFAIALAATIGVAFAANMVTLFVFYEALTLSTYPLVTHHGGDEAKRAGRLYLGILLGTSIGLQLLAIVWTYQLAGTLDFTPGGILRDKAPAGVLGALFVLYVLGTGKAALMPLHRWLPAAMVAPTPVSALLHAVAVVKAGVFTVLKISVYLFGPELLAETATSGWLLYLAAATILIASLVALTKDNLKLRLAYSTISQLSYVLLGALLGNTLAIVGGGLHIAMHAFAKITLFFCAGAIAVATHKTEISQMDGIGRRMPWTMGAFAIVSLSMIGLPPTAGFVSKWYLLRGAIEAEHMVAVAVIVVSTLLNAAYFLPVVFVAFFRPAQEDNLLAAGDHSARGRGEAPLLMVSALIATAFGTVVLFFFPGALLELAHQIVGDAR
ncbi:MAG: monovalent cation/H+ antiporter subunit D family protein [Alphaproteobacteria bacterium]|nr:monovalent cation/H+ antiporter subunit D family protein [Alphaproteobacteria bacterium]